MNPLLFVCKAYTVPFVGANPFKLAICWSKRVKTNFCVGQDPVFTCQTPIESSFSLYQNCQKGCKLPIFGHTYLININQHSIERILLAVVISISISVSISIYIFILHTCSIGETSNHKMFGFILPADRWHQAREARLEASLTHLLWWDWGVKMLENRLQKIIPPQKITPPRNNVFFWLGL